MRNTVFQGCHYFLKKTGKQNKSSWIPVPYWCQFFVFLSEWQGFLLTKARENPWPWPLVTFLVTFTTNKQRFGVFCKHALLQPCQELKRRGIAQTEHYLPRVTTDPNHRKFQQVPFTPYKQQTKRCSKQFGLYCMQYQHVLACNKC